MRELVKKRRVLRVYLDKESRATLGFSEGQIIEELTKVVNNCRQFPTKIRWTDGVTTIIFHFHKMLLGIPIFKIEKVYV
jgi:hypothetical protein